MKILIEVPSKNTQEIAEAIDKMKSESEVDKLNAVCFWLIKICKETNATSAKINQENVTHLGKPLGNWEITIKKK